MLYFDYLHKQTVKAVTLNYSFTIFVHCCVHSLPVLFIFPRGLDVLLWDFFGGDLEECAEDDEPLPDKDSDEHLYVSSELSSLYALVKEALVFGGFLLWGVATFLNWAASQVAMILTSIYGIGSVEDQESYNTSGTEIWSRAGEVISLSFSFLAFFSTQKRFSGLRRVKVRVQVCEMLGSY